MLLAVILPIVALAIGAGLAFFGGAHPRVLSPLRSFALASVLVAIALHILPEALADGGPWVFVVFIAGLMAPTALSRLLARRGSSKADDDHGHAHLAGRMAFGGVLLHQLGDGLALGSFSGMLHSGHVHWDVLLGIAAHTVPLAAVLTLTTLSQRGARAALFDAVMMGVATLLGIALSRAGGPDLGQQVAPWMGAAVAGLLVHVLTHDVPSPPRTAITRTIELAAIVVGILLPIVAGMAEHGSHTDETNVDSVLPMISVIARTVAPLLLLGLLLPLMLRKLSVRRSNGIAAALAAQACACSASPIAASLDRARGRGTPLAFSIAAPELAVATVLLSLMLLGWQVAVLRVVGALLLATIGARWFGRPRDTSKPTAATAVPHSPDSLTALDELVLHTTPWLVVGIAAAGLAQLAVVHGAIASTGNGWLDLAVVMALAVPAYVCAPAATPLAAILVAAGLPPGAALAGLLLGSATTMAAPLLRECGRGVRAMALAAAVSISVAMAAAYQLLAPASATVLSLPSALGPSSPLAIACTVVLGVLLLRALWRYGLAAFLEPLHGGAHEHQHHQHADGAPCTVDCHDDASSTLPVPAHDHHGHGHDHHGHDHHGHD